MNAERLVALYEKAAEAPDAGKRLRRFVLDLAVRGKLVAQDAGDEPASELLKRIAAEKARMVKAGEIRKLKALPLKDPDTWPFLLPEGWTWACVDELSPRSLTDGDWIETKDQSENGGIRLIQLADVGSGAFLDKSSRFINAETEVRLNCTRLAVGDVLIARLPNPIGRACIFPDIGQPAITAVDVAILRPDSNISAEYIVAAINAPPTRDQVEAYGKGATRFRVSTGHLKTVLIPLPPFAEQRRIVAKVEELMALLDWLEAARTAREATRDQLTAASLARLTAPDTTAENFLTHARFALATLPALTARPNQIKPLRQAILNLAVRGKLVEQDPTDGPVSVSLEAIGAKRDAMVQNKELRREKPHKPVQAEDVPFEIPSTWRWVRVGDLALFTQYGTSAKSAPSETGIPVLTMGNIQDGAVIRTNEKRIPQASDELPSLYLKNFDLLYNRTNSAELVGKTGLYCGDDDSLTFASYLIRIRLSIDETSPIYINLAMNAPDFRETQIVPHIKKQTGQANVSGSALKNMLIPLPPLAKQHRIVAKVDALMALCDRLEVALTTTDTTRARLLGALLHEALIPTVAQPAEAVA